MRRSVGRLFKSPRLPYQLSVQKSRNDRFLGGWGLKGAHHLIMGSRELRDDVICGKREIWRKAERWPVNVWMHIWSKKKIFITSGVVFKLS